MESKKRRTSPSSGQHISQDDVRMLMESLSKEQLQDLLHAAAHDHPDVLNRLRDIADKDPSHRKLFVHGLNWDITTEALSAAYSSYGEIEDCIVVTDKKTGKSKGYGFVTFKHRDGAHRALNDATKMIDGRRSYCQFSTSGPPSAALPNSFRDASVLARKIYVSNVPSSMPPDKLLEYFSKYGEIEEGPLGFDRETGKSKGYALFIYKSVDSVIRVLEEPVKSIEGFQMMCKLADPKPKNVGDSQLAGLGIPASNLANSSALLGLHSGQQSALTTQSLLTGLPPTNTSLVGLNTTLYPSIGSSIAQQLALNPSLGSSLNPLLTPLSATLSGSLIGQGAIQGLTQAQILSSARNPYGLSGLGVQVPGLGGTSALDSSVYGLSSSIQGSGTYGVAGSRLSSLSFK